jgi:uncharacterized protein YycO
MINIFRRYLIRFLKPISILLGKLYFAPKQRCIKASDVIFLNNLLLPGDVLLTFSLGELTNSFIEGEFKHCAMYAGLGRIIEAVGSGVRGESLEEFCASKDLIGVFRARFCDEATAKKAVQFAEKQIGQPYDYSFEPNEKAFYCAELVATAYMFAMDDKAPFKYRKVLGIDTVLPIDFKLATKKFDQITERPL